MPVAGAEVFENSAQSAASDTDGDGDTDESDDSDDNIDNDTEENGSEVASAESAVENCTVPAHCDPSDNTM